VYVFFLSGVLFRIQHERREVSGAKDAQMTRMIRVGPSILRCAHASSVSALEAELTVVAGCSMGRRACEDVVVLGLDVDVPKSRKDFLAFCVYLI